MKWRTRLANIGPQDLVKVTDPARRYPETIASLGEQALHQMNQGKNNVKNPATSLRV